MSKTKVKPKPIQKQILQPRSSLGKMLGARPIKKPLSGVSNGAPHVVVIARPGTGKTSSCVEAVRLIKGMKSLLIPSSEQKLIWDEAVKTPKNAKVAFVAFGKHIAKELEKRMPPGAEATTVHSFGYRVLASKFGKPQLDMKKYRTKGMICNLLGIEPNDLWDNDADDETQKRLTALRAKVEATQKMVDLSKLTLLDYEGSNWLTDIEELMIYYEIDPATDKRQEVFEMVKTVLIQSAKYEGTIEFPDMLWLPVVLNLPIPQYDVLFCDEMQDLSRVQQEILIRTNARLFGVGDPKQSIFGFAGADVKSIPRMQELLGKTKRGVVTLGLTLSRRCSKKVVEVANRECKMTDFHAHESNSEGAELEYTFDDYRQHVQSTDFVLCRTNAPLVRQAFKFIKEGRHVFIKGADIGRNLIQVVQTLGSKSKAEFLIDLKEWYDTETAKIKGKSNSAEARRITLEDKFDCLKMFGEAATTPRDIVTRIKAVFQDDGKGITLSSIHAIKGLETRNVFLLQPKRGGCPHQLATTPWQLEQESNCLWIAITRSIDTFAWVREVDDEDGN